MGLCWSESPVSPQKPYAGEKPIATAPPYMPPPPQQYTYAIYPPQQQQQYYYAQQQVYPQQVYYQQQQSTISPAGAFVGGLVVGAVMEDILDPDF